MLRVFHRNILASATNVVVVGAGIVDFATALNLLRAGRSDFN
jgi:glycine/D-amino acid oxidase-like deaminating enzyme